VTEIKPYGQRGHPQRRGRAAAPARPLPGGDFRPAAPRTVVWTTTSWLRLPGCFSTAEAVKSLHVARRPASGGSV